MKTIFFILLSFVCNSQFSYSIPVVADSIPYSNIDTLEIYKGNTTGIYSGEIRVKAVGTGKTKVTIQFGQRKKRFVIFPLGDQYAIKYPDVEIKPNL